MAIASRIWGVIIVIMHFPPQKGFHFLILLFFTPLGSGCWLVRFPFGISSVFCMCEEVPFPAGDERGCAVIQACILRRDNGWT